MPQLSTRRDWTLLETPCEVACGTCDKARPRSLARRRNQGAVIRASGNVTASCFGHDVVLASEVGLDES